MDGDIRIRITGGTNMEKVLVGSYIIVLIGSKENGDENFYSMNDGSDVVEITIHKPALHIDTFYTIAKFINNAAKEQASDIRVEISND